ncbi:AbrB/MazE/SpoVT family DNA-binding domain-containing protein [Terracidiphilus sp.]|jgi:putative addiction module antidote|uniref:AbrB/MazE/SpoVT family DNA-binding domain-containing protein n=1 Tax=Terracidiphilus sp. TaxID=1964191 RepID=UPI003C13D350
MATSSKATALKIIPVGNSSGILLPREVLSDLHVEQGDILFYTRTEKGCTLTPYDEEFAAQMEAAREIMRQNRDVLQRLAE